MTTATPAPKKKTPRKTAAAEPAIKTETVATVESAAPAAPAKKRTRKVATPKQVSPEERHHLIKVAAYYLAERRGFGSGSIHDDWVQAEQEIDQMIAAGKFAS